MKSILTFLFVLGLSWSTAQNTTSVNLDKSKIEWIGKKLTGQHNGNIVLKSGDLVFYEGKLLKGLFKIDMNSISCSDLKGESADKLVNHLKSEDFFNSNKFPEALLNFREVKHIEGSSYLIIADLSIKGITKTIEFNADIRENKASAVINVDRTDYDIRYGSKSFFDELGDKAIDDIFVIKIDLVFNPLALNQDFNILYLRNADYSCEIISTYGACINSYKFKDREFISGYQSKEEVSLQQYKGVLLAPFPNRIAKAKFSFDDQHHALTINRAKEGLALHGFLYDKEFRLIEKDADKLILAYDYDGDAAGYPFPFSIAVSYYLEEQGLLRIKTHISNEGKQRLPFGLGWHPYFQMESIIDDLSLSFPSSSYLELDEKLIPTGELKAFAEKQKILRLDNQNYDTCFLLDSQDSASFILSDKTMDLHISTPSIEHFPYFQIYTAKDRKSIAIEPMTCAPNAFNNGMGVRILNPGESAEVEFGIQALRRN